MVPSKMPTTVSRLSFKSAHVGKLYGTTSALNSLKSPYKYAYPIKSGMDSTSGESEIYSAPPKCTEPLAVASALGMDPIGLNVTAPHHMSRQKPLAAPLLPETAE